QTTHATVCRGELESREVCEVVTDDELCALALELARQLCRTVVVKRAAALKVVGASVVRNVGNRRERSEIAVEAGTAGGGTSHAREGRRRIDAREHERASVFVCMRIVGQPASFELLGRLPDEFAGQR